MLLRAVPVSRNCGDWRTIISTDNRTNILDHRVNGQPFD